MFRRRYADEQDSWLKDLFQSRTAGAEFMLPWTIDTYFTTMTALKKMFSAAELKAIIEAHRDAVLDTSHLRLAHLLLQVLERDDSADMHRHGSSPVALENKCRRLDDTQAAVLILWASAFWRGRDCSDQSMEKYIAVK